MTRIADGGMVLARGPARFDVSATTRLALGSSGAPSGQTARKVGPGRIAHQIRQDVWRALRHLRGFRPVVAVTPVAGGLEVVAGGAVEGALPPNAAARIADVLEDPANRARWLAHAGKPRARGTPEKRQAGRAAR
ncbi:MAG: hypothetical protein CSA74_10640 [Rhodobacterales bacterium]|nr:MAG: hypothetical protein CSA74_10640 [Rhodobacterales bacterium]